MPIQYRSFYDAAEKGRQDRQAYETNLLNQQQAQQQIAQQNRLGALYDNPNATAEQFTRAGRSDIGNSLLNIQSAPAEQKAAQLKEFATQMTNAAKYSLQVPPAQTKAFVEQNFPQLVKEYGPAWATTPSEQIHNELQGTAAKFATMAGIAPERQPGESGAMYRYVNEKGQPVYGNAQDVRGKTPYETPEKAPPIPSGYEPDPSNPGALRPRLGGPADPNAGKGKITDNERLTAAFATRMRKAADALDALNYTPTTSDMVLFNRMLSGGPGITQSMANKMLSPQAQQYLQGLQDFSRAKLRKESGAVIGKDEVFGDLSTFFPVPGDDPTTLAQKKQARETAIEGMISAAGPAYKAPAKANRAPPEAEAYLKQHPELKEQFKAKYGYLP